MQDFVGALLDPMVHAKDLRGHPNSSTDFPTAASYCIKRDDRSHGITDELTFAQVYYSKAPGTALAYTLDFSHYLGVEDYSAFHDKSIAHTYHVSTRDDTKLQGLLTTLEDWKPGAAQLSIVSPTAPRDRILTSLVSTAAEDSLLQSAPKDVHWPRVREERLEGSIIRAVGLGFIRKAGSLLPIKRTLA